jgi:hypothetical protein
MTLGLSAVTVAGVAGAIVGTVLASGGETSFLIDDTDSIFNVTGGTPILSLAVVPPAVGFYDLRLLAISGGFITDGGEFIVNVGLSPDGANIGGGLGTILASSGAWTFGAPVAASPGNWDIHLNGAGVFGWQGQQIEVSQGGQVFVKGISGNWWKYTSAGFVAGTP